MVEHPHLTKPTINDVFDAVDRDGGFGDVCGEDYFALAELRFGEGGELEFGGEGGEEGQDGEVAVLGGGDLKGFLF
jgi:hypothetical protein